MISVTNTAKSYPVSSTSIQVVASIDTRGEPLNLNDVLTVVAEMGVTTPQPVTGGYNTLVGTRIVLADSATNVKGTLVASGIGQNVTPSQHHMLTTRAALHQLKRMDRPWLNLVAWFDATRAAPGDMIAMDICTLSFLKA